MTICPIAIAVGCQKCPVFKLCPVKSMLGDQPKVVEKDATVKASPKPAAKAARKAASPRKSSKK